MHSILCFSPCLKPLGVFQLHQVTMTVSAKAEAEPGGRQQLKKQPLDLAVITASELKALSELRGCDDVTVHTCLLSKPHSFYLASVTVFQRRSDCTPGDCITQQHSFLSHLVGIFFFSDPLSRWSLSVMSFKPYTLCLFSILNHLPLIGWWWIS